MTRLGERMGRARDAIEDRWDSRFGSMMEYDDTREYYAAVRARTGGGTRGMKALRDLPGGYGRFVSTLVFDRYPSFYGSTPDEVIDSAARRWAGGYLTPNGIRANLDALRYEVRGVRERLHTRGEVVPSEVADKLKGVIVGTGPAALVAGGLLRDLGFNNISYISPDTEIGGIWAPDAPWGQERDTAFNNPRSFDVNGSQLRVPRRASDRRKEAMRMFLRDVADPEVQAKMILGRATGADFDGRTHTVHYRDADGAKTIDADFVIVAAGNTPLPLEGKASSKYFSLKNTDLVPSRRWPDLMDDAEVIRMSDAGQRIVCVGWGNSTMAKLREIELTNRRLGTNLQAVVLTHFTQEALDNPHTPTKQPDGKYRTVARDPDRGEYTKLELDIPESERLYYRSIDQQRGFMGRVLAGTIPSVTACEFVRNGNGTVDAKVTRKISRYRSVVETIPNVGELDEFIGFGNDVELMKGFGFEVTDKYRGTVKQRGFDGRAITRDDRNIHVLGATAYTREDPSDRVIPGIIKKSAEVALTVIYYAALKAYDDAKK